MPVRDGLSSRLSGIPSLVAFAMVTRIQKADMTISARTNLAVKLFSLLWAKYRDDKEVSATLDEIGLDLRNLRENYENVVDFETWAAEKQSQFNQFLDGIEYRLDRVVVLTKIIDTASLRDMAVPE